MTWDAVAVALLAAALGVLVLRRLAPFQRPLARGECRSCGKNFALWERQVAARGVEAVGDE